eukprot:GGOE01020434.1.p1 GENE.GGOE01020434.1~~GGOE01020434.1.p1  ORF type:complete len:524 (-),score=66.08 GGOE01020434.1:113-1684(-)
MPNATNIIQMKATTILEELKAGRLKAVDVMRVYCTRALYCGEKLELLAEEGFVAALEAAQLADQHLQEGKLLGPLHGLPFSVKDCVDMKGKDSTCGVMARTFEPSMDDAVLVALLRQQGAIPFVRTNVPQCLMLPESDNRVWGQAKNPFNIKRTPGGSSGGEAGLIAARGSPIGIGTDIGGSIRIPSHMCGICGFLPTVGRLSAKGCRVPRPKDRDGQMAIRASPGPMGRCVDDLNLLMNAWCQPKMSEMDPTVPPLPWRQDLYACTRKLRFGFYTFDGYFSAAPACTRAVEEAAKALQIAGHEVVPFPVDFYDVIISYLSILSSDGKLRGFTDGLEGEKLLPSYRFLLFMASLPNWVRPLLSGVLRLLGQRRMADVVVRVGAKSTYDHWEVVGERNLWRKEFIKRWQREGLDVVLCPAVALPAFPHGMSTRLNQACSYTFVFNNLGFPAGVVPATTVRASEETYSCIFQDPMASDAAQACRGSSGLPVAIQVAALPWHDELCLRAMREVESALNFPCPMPDV